MKLSFYFSVPHRERSVINDVGLVTMVIAVLMILAVVIVIMISITIKQKGYIKSVFNLLFGYTEKRFIQIPLNEPFWKETLVEIPSQVPQEPPS